MRIMSKHIMVRADKDTWIDLVKAPHILIGGSTGSGKSYLMKSMLCDILEKNDGVNIIVIDPKSVDYQFLVSRGLERARFEGDTGEPDVISEVYKTIYGEENREGARESRRYANFFWAWKGIELIDRQGIDNGRALKVLRLLCNEMDRRYRLMKEYQYSEWGDYVEDLRENELDAGYSGTDPWLPEGRAERIVSFVDELTDWTYWDRDRDRGEYRGLVEKYLVRLAMLGRAAGIHLVLGTQRPDAQVLSGQLRANIPTRICLRVANKTERRIVLGMSGEGQEREMVYLSQYSSLGWDLR